MKNIERLAIYPTHSGGWHLILKVKGKPMIELKTDTMAEIYKITDEYIANNRPVYNDSELIGHWVHQKGLVRNG